MMLCEEVEVKRDRSYLRGLYFDAQKIRWFLEIKKKSSVK